MLRLMKLELRQNRLKPYILASFGISAVLLAFTYLFAFIPHLNAKSDLEEMVMDFVRNLFGSYESMIGIICILSMFCFSVMAATMLSKFVVLDYTGKRANILFAYPVDRSKLLLAKIVLVFLFVVCAQLFVDTLVFGIFFLSESFYPLVIDGVLSSKLILDIINITVIFSISSAAIGIISVWFGFKRKSVTGTMIPAYILSAVFSNIVGPAMLIGKTLALSTVHITIVGLALLAASVFTYRLMYSVNKMEAE